MATAKVFAIDDDPALLFLLKLTLEKADSTAKLTTFSHGGKAIDFLTENAHDLDKLPDVILLDINMPVMDGWEFLDIFASAPTLLSTGIPIYILSSSIAEKDRAKAELNKLVKAYISKPLEEKALADILNSVRK